MTSSRNKEVFFLKRALFDFKFLILFLSLQIPVLHQIFKYLPNNLKSFVPLYFIVAFLGYAFILYNRKINTALKSLLQRQSVFLGLVVLMVVINIFVYPAADNLKMYMRGNDEDDALIQGGWRLIRGLNPYQEKTYLNGPISPGPGWVILTLPFTLSGLYFLFTPLLVAVAAFWIQRATSSFYNANMFLIFLMSSLLFWQILVTGSDLLAIGLAFLLCSVLIFYTWDKNLVYTLACALLASFIATSRIIFAYLIPIIAVFLWKRDRHAAVRFFALCSILILFLHFIFYAWDPASYTPLHHIFGAGINLLYGKIAFFAPLAFIALVIFMALKVRNRIDSWLVFLWIALALPLMIVSFKSLSALSYNFSQWGYSLYLAIPLPLYVAYFCLQLTEDKKEIVANEQRHL